MTRELRLVLGVAVVVVLLGAATAALLLSPADKGDARLRIKDAQPADIERISIRNAHGLFDISFTGEGYVADDIPTDLVDLDEFYDLLTDCAQVRALRVVSEKPDDLAPFGLSEPAARVAITYKDGTGLTLLVGQAERVTGDYYLRLADEPAVYLVDAERCSAFLLPKRAFVEDLITPKLALSSPLSALLDVTFVGGALPGPVTIQAVASGDPEVVRAATSFGAATHIVRRRGVYELDQTYGVEMLGSLLGLTAKDVVGYGLSADEIDRFGFDQPDMRVEFDLKNGLQAEIVHYALRVLRRGDDFFLTCNDNGVIYVVPEPPFLRLEFRKLLVRWFLAPIIMDVREVVVTSEGQEYDFRLSGRTSAELQVTCNGQSLDVQRFRTFYSLLVSAAHDGDLLGDVSVSGEPLLQVAYYYVDDTKPPDVMRLYPGDTRRVYVQVNGVTELAMRKTYVARVQSAVKALWTDQPIEVNW